jgi:hypothetical protein
MYTNAQHAARVPHAPHDCDTARRTASTNSPNMAPHVMGQRPLLACTQQSGGGFSWYTCELYVPGMEGACTGSILVHTL